MPRHNAGPDERSYEWKAVALLAFGFALVNLDRFIMYPLFPVMMRDLGVDYQDLGLISAAVAITWGLASMVFGRLSDRMGRRGILVTSVLVFSLVCGLTGLAAGVGSLLLIRAVMGVFEGAYAPTSIAAVVDASGPGRVGRNVGIQQLVAPLVGIALAPILAIQLLGMLPSWRWVFVVATVPGLLCAWLIYRTLREHAPDTARASAPAAAWREVLRYRNVPRNILGFCFWLSPLIVLAALLPSYLTDHLHLPLEQMGAVVSAMGFGGAAGMLLVPALSDRFGRRTIVVACLTLAIPLLVILMRAGPDPVQLFILVFAANMLIAGVVSAAHAITADSVPAQHMSTVTGLVVGIGEIVGGSVAPALAGALAKAYGIQTVIPFSIASLVIGLVVALSLESRDGSQSIRIPQSAET